MPKPIAIIQTNRHNDPGYFADFLTARSLPFQVFSMARAEVVPELASAFSGICLFGGPMSVNDPLPWIAPVVQLVRQAIAQDIPVMGHCLGGQLLAAALGAQVGANPQFEIGWQTVNVVNDAAAYPWFGGATRFLSYHWHGETFSLPAGAIRIAGSEACANQVFVYAGKHLGMQFHIEMTEPKIREWCIDFADELIDCAGPFVESAESQLTDLAVRVAGLNRMADNIYGQWLKGLSH